MVDINDYPNSLLDQNRAELNCVVNSIIQKETKKSGLIIGEVEYSFFAAGDTIETPSCLVHKSEQLNSRLDHIQQQIPIGVLCLENLYAPMAAVLWVVDVPVPSEETRFGEKRLYLGRAGLVF